VSPRQQFLDPKICLSSFLPSSSEKSRAFFPALERQHFSSDMSNGSSDNDSDADMDALFMGAAVTATVAVATLTQHMMTAVAALPEERTPRPAAEYRHRADWAATPC
jgi:hypothetical protein